MTGKYLNIGCGSHYHTDWVNVDFVSNSRHVIAHNLVNGIPFDDSTFDVAYHSHVLEHFSQQEGVRLLKECHRVLKKGGTLRIAVPDLEQIARNYLTYLDQAVHGEKSADFRYEWSKIELIDQIARNFSGGTMGQNINSANGEDFDFIKSRLGMEVTRGESGNAPVKNGNRYIRAVKRRLTFKHVQYCIAKTGLFLIGGKGFTKAFDIGYFRLFTGENHQWMYDRYSLNKILQQTGFENTRICEADESRIPGFAGYELDMVNGRVRKPDSIFIEATKR